MAIGDITPKKLYQGLLDQGITAKYTTPTNTRTQIVEIWIDNQNTSTNRVISLYAHGTATVNRLAHNIQVIANSSMVLSDNKIILTSGESLAMIQDNGNDVIVTVYGIEEVIA